MTFKRAPRRRAPVLTFEEHHRVTQVVTLLATVARRTHAHKRKATKTQPAKEGIKVRLTREPCFFNRTFYHEVIDLPFIQSDYHDRHNYIDLQKQHVPHH